MIIFHAKDWIRTRDLQITKQPPYHLCYLAYLKQLWENYQLVLFFYQVALLNSSGEINFRAELTIMNLDEEDEKNEYHLVNYFFFLK